MKSENILILPGWQGSGPQHWQSLWQAQSGFQRVEQHDWLQPLRGDWIARLEDVVLSTDEPAVLVAQEALRPMLASWLPIPLQALPFKSTLVASQDDPYCSLERALGFAAAWGSRRVDAGAAGHINADSGLGDWPQGQALLNELIQI